LPTLPLNRSTSCSLMTWVNEPSTGYLALAEVTVEHLLDGAHRFAAWWQARRVHAEAI
jgi:hypothetical protein